MPDNDQTDDDTAQADRRNGDAGADLPAGEDEGGAYQPPEPPLQGD